MSIPPRLVEVRQHILKRNDEVARQLRSQFAKAGTYVVSLVSSPGAGKTAFLEETLTRLRVSHRVAALVGDLATDNDARRLARSRVPVRQITTGTLCHLEADMISTALDGWELTEIDYLFIENVGNLVCPSTFDLGENLRLVLFSVTEGEDKPLKYPTIFHTADVALISKSDLAAAVDFDNDLARQSIQSIRPGMEIIEVSAKSGEGLDRWLAFIESRRAEFSLQADRDCDASTAAAPQIRNTGDHQPSVTSTRAIS
jgi:hydrogenase nickel incorporation protein HypB